MNKIVLIGDGGHSKVIQDIIHANQDLSLTAILDSKYSESIEKDEIKYEHTDAIQAYLSQYCLFCIAIGNNEIRQKLVDTLNIPMTRYALLVHPSAVISPSAEIGRGTVVMPNATINADTKIGEHCIVNSNAVIEHDNIIEDYAHISPNATLAGTVSVGKGTHIGSNATIIPNKKVGSWSVIGAGAVVINNIESNITAVGVPALPIKKK